MAAIRSSWRGALKLSLITIPVRAYPATREGADVSFRQFHRTCQTRIQLRKWCPTCDIEVKSGDIVKGYEASKGRYVFVEPEEIAKLRPRSSTTVSVSEVVASEQVDPRLIERTYYLAPDTKDAGGPFAVVREALASKAAVGRLALHGREYLVAVVADGTAMRLYTLRTAGEVLAQDGIEPLAFAEAPVKAEELKLARRVLDTFETDKDLGTFVDNYQDALRDMLRRKGAGVPTEPAATERTGGGVVNLMEALRQSLEAARPAAKAARKSASKGRRRQGKVIDHPSRGKMRKAS
jgi:DNA end-binding protein Ku